MTKKRISQACEAHSFTPVLRRKLKPRGKAFTKGNSAGEATRFKAGAPSANPGGRPRSKLISEALRWMLATALDVPIVVETRAEQLAYTLIREGLRAKIGAIVEVADRVEGKPHTSISISDEDPLAALTDSMRELAKELGPPENETCGDDEIVQ